MLLAILKKLHFSASLLIHWYCQICMFESICFFLVVFASVWCWMFLLLNFFKLSYNNKCVGDKMSDCIILIISIHIDFTTCWCSSFIVIFITIDRWWVLTSGYIYNTWSLSQFSTIISSISMNDFNTLNFCIFWFE